MSRRVKLYGKASLREPNNCNKKRETFIWISTELLFYPLFIVMQCCCLHHPSASTMATLGLTHCPDLGYYLIPFAKWSTICYDDRSSDNGLQWKNSLLEKGRESVAGIATDHERAMRRDYDTGNREHEAVFINENYTLRPYLFVILGRSTSRRCTRVGAQWSCLEKDKGRWWENENRRMRWVRGTWNALEIF